MTTPGSKTPVSIVNEYFTRRGCSPKFELVVNRCGTHNPTFAYILECEGVEYKAVGKGRSKQEAKHEAAKKMLLHLNSSWEEENEVNELVLPHENSISYNAVGELMDFCKKECYPHAMFYGGGDTGLPHEKIFTIKCCVSQLTTVGEARTKKQAKQIAAHKMLMQLQLEAGEKPLAVAVPNSINVENVFQGQGEIGKAISVYKPHPLLYKDFSNAYLGLLEKSETLSSLMRKELTASISNSCQLTVKIYEELGVAISLDRISCDGTFSELPANVLSCIELDQSFLKEIHEGDEETVTFLFLTLHLNPAIVIMENNLPQLCLSLLNYLIELCS